VTNVSGSPKFAPSSHYPVTTSILDFQVSALESDRCLRLVCCFTNESTQSVYVQNQYGNPYDFRMGEVGGGRSPNAPLRAASQFSTSPACMWPDGDGSLMVFQGEVPCPVRPYDRRWPSPAYSRLATGESTFEIRSVLPMRQWENNFPRAATGPRISIHRVRVCIEILLGPLAVEEINGVCACDYGQPAYVERSVELDRPIQFITDSTHPKRAQEKRAALQSCVRLGGPRAGPVTLAVATK
jgi:hypothetical protein